MGVPRIFHSKPSIVGSPHLWKSPFSVGPAVDLPCLGSEGCLPGETAAVEEPPTAGDVSSTQMKREEKRQKQTDQTDQTEQTMSIN